MLRRLSRTCYKSSQVLYRQNPSTYVQHEALNTLTKSALAIRHNSSVSAELGLRRTNPPDSNNSPTPKPKSPKPPEEISDQEWEIRTGRATDILQNTLPHFFATGLMSSFDKTTGEPHPASAGIHIPVVNPLENRSRNEGLESIYSSKIRLSYTPPTALPPPFPKTLHFEGKPLYLASAAFVRHTLNTLYSDLRVTIHKVIINTPKSGLVPPNDPEEGSQNSNSPRKKNREKSLFIGLRVTGTSRVSGGISEWEVNSTYTFSPLTGLIYVHTVNSIEPAPHQTVYDALRASLGNVFGYGFPETPAGPRAGSTTGATCGGKRSDKRDSYDKITPE